MTKPAVATNDGGPLITNAKGAPMTTEKSTPPLTAERVRELLDYDPATGWLTWRSSRGRVKAGARAGCIDQLGYRKIGFDCVAVRAHRLIWLHVHGVWPTNEIDHRNGNRDDNWLANLRDVTISGNAQNRRRARADSQTGLLGASPYRGGFRAEIMVNRKRLRLGCFDTPEAAHAAYLAAKRSLHSTCSI